LIVRGLEYVSNKGSSHEKEGVFGEDSDQTTPITSIVITKTVVTGKIKF